MGCERNYSINKSVITEEIAKELTNKEILQIGAVNYHAYQVVCNILHFDPDSNDLPWDMEWIGELSELIVDFICEKFNKDKQALYPSIHKK